MKIVGLDLSLTSTGVAQIASNGNGRGLRVTLDRITSKPTADTIAARSVRLRKMAGQVIGLSVGADLVMIEGPAFASSTGAIWDRAGLWWLVVGRLTGLGLPVVEVPPTTLKCYAVGKGNAGKDLVLAAVIKRYAHAADVTGNDVADALALASMGARYLGCEIEESLPDTHTRAMKAVKFPPIPTRQEHRT